MHSLVPRLPNVEKIGEPGDEARSCIDVTGLHVDEEARISALRWDFSE